MTATVQMSDGQGPSIYLRVLRRLHRASSMGLEIRTGGAPVAGSSDQRVAGFWMLLVIFQQFGEKN